MNLQPVVLSGGSGTRLWPLSREQYPKQLLPLVDERTMLQATALRLSSSPLPPTWTLNAPIIVGNEDYRFITAEQLRQVGLNPAAIILEPVGRNTAPALTLAALAVVASGRDPVLVVMPADHAITDEPAFAEAVFAAAAFANAGLVVTFGIPPTAPETGYGYIEAGSPVGDSGAFAIARFVEKPDAATAQDYLQSGRFLWNSGIFVLRASVWLQHIGTAQPAILQACEAAMSASEADNDFLRVDKNAFTSCPSESIDYAVMESLAEGEGMVLPMSVGWSDVGAWSALHDICEKDPHDNVLIGDVIALDTHDSLVRAESRLVACIGMRETIVVETPDAVLVANRKDIQQVKQLVAALKANGRSEPEAHRKVFRPWGYYDSIDAGSRFQVKRLVIYPGARLSLQLHHHRAEHWIVVTGTAQVTRGEETLLLSENESIYIPLGTTHRLENPGRIPLELIEVQSGSYLGEDDIVRFDDAYGRG